MAKPTEQSGESFMLKLARFIVDKRNLVFLVVIIGLIFSVYVLAGRNKLRRQAKLIFRHFLHHIKPFPRAYYL